MKILKASMAFCAIIANAHAVQGPVTLYKGQAHCVSKFSYGGHGERICDYFADIKLNYSKSGGYRLLSTDQKVGSFGVVLESYRGGCLNTPAKERGIPKYYQQGVLEYFDFPNYKGAYRGMLSSRLTGEVVTSIIEGENGQVAIETQSESNYMSSHENTDSQTEAKIIFNPEKKSFKINFLKTEDGRHQRGQSSFNFDKTKSKESIVCRPL